MHSYVDADNYSMKQTFLLIFVFVSCLPDCVLSKMEAGVKSYSFIRDNMQTGNKTFNFSFLEKFHIRQKISCFANCMVDDSCVALSVFDQNCTLLSLHSSDVHELNTGNNTFFFWRKVLADELETGQVIY